MVRCWGGSGSRKREQLGALGAASCSSCDSCWICGWRQVGGSAPGRQVQFRALGGVRVLMVQGGWAFPVVMQYAAFTVLLLLPLV